MKKIIIEDVRYGFSEGGIACGPVGGEGVVEALIRKENGDRMYFGLVEAMGTLNFYGDRKSRYDNEIEGEFDETIGPPECAEGFGDRYDFYEAMDEMIRTDKAHALLLKYLACFVYLSDDRCEQLRQASVGKAIGSFEIPVCTEEEEYLEKDDDFLL